MLGTKITFQNGEYKKETIRTGKHNKKLVEELKELDWQSWAEIKDKVDRYFYPENYK